MITGAALVRATEILCALSLLIQGWEYWSIRGLQTSQGPWAWSVQGRDVPPGGLHRLLDVVFADAVHQAHLLLRLVLAGVLAVWGGSLGLVLALWLGQVLFMIRWRGAFNGGSDFMTQVVLTGLLLGHGLMGLGRSDVAWPLGLGWIAVNATTSYVIAGWIKWLQPEWRSGAALAVFLDTGLHGPLPAHSIWRRPAVARAAAWAFMAWEATFPLAFLSVPMALLECAVALVFHLLVFRFFGLNRFVWAWLAAFPSVIWGSIWVGLSLA